MRGTLLDNNADIYLHLTQEELNCLNLGELEIKNNKVVVIYEPLECKLQKTDGADSERRVRLEHWDLEEFGDGIEVKYKKGTYLIKMNGRALDFLDEKRYTETRNIAGEKISIDVSEET